jgi:hypothetical protein
MAIAPAMMDVAVFAKQTAIANKPNHLFKLTGQV